MSAEAHIYYKALYAERETKKYTDLFIYWSLSTQVNVMANSLVSDVQVRMFEIQSRYSIHIRTCTCRNGMNLLIILAQSAGAVEYTDYTPAEG